MKSMNLAKVSSKSLVDIAILIAMSALFYFSSFTGLEVRLLSIIALFGIYFFDRSRNKYVTWISILISLSFLLTFRDFENSLSYSTYSVIHLGFFVWLSAKLSLEGVIKRIWTIFLFFIFTVLQILSLKIIPVVNELNIFIFLSLLFGLAPVFIERTNRREKINIYRAMVFQQILLRLFFIFWALFYRIELNSIMAYENYSLVVVSILLFIPFIGLVNWRNICWDYLTESFISILIILACLAANTEALSLAIILGLVGSINSLHKPFHYEGSSKISFIVEKLEAGGVGSFVFFISLGIAYYCSKGSFALFSPFLFLSIFLLGWANWVKRSDIEGDVITKDLLFGKLCFHFITPLWLIIEIRSLV